MSKIRLHGSSSGYTEIAPVAASGNNTLTLPDDGTILSKDAAGAVGVTSVHTTNITATGIATITTAKIGAGVTITESGIEASGIGITCANLNGGQFGRRNKVINGAMKIAQRSTSVASITSGDYYVCDRWKLGYGTAGTWTLSQSTDTPDNFGKSLKMDCTSANTSLSAGSNLQLIQQFEGQDLQDIQKGTSSAREVTVSFYVKTNKTGTYIVELMDHDNSNRHCSKSYTVSDTNWNRYTLTFPADTTGTLDDDANKSFEVGFWLVAGSTFTSGSLQTSWGALSQSTRAVGQVNLADSTSNEWYLTGVQLEVGSQATAFEHRTAGEELALCQRYYFKFLEGNNKEIAPGWYYNGSHVSFILRYPTTMRTTPTGSVTDVSNSITIYRNGAADQFDGFSFEYGSTEQYSAYNSTQVSGTAGQCGIVRSTSSAAKIEFSAEL